MAAVAKFKNKQSGRAGTGESSISFSEMKEEQKEKDNLNSKKRERERCEMYIGREQRYSDSEVSLVI